MTRINCIPPHELVRQHLVAEYRELPRTFALAKAWHARGGGDLPETYRLGAGHIKFFYNRLAWLYDRQVSLIVEMKARGYKANHDDPSGLLEGVPDCLMGEWEPTPEAMAENRERIALRLQGK